MAINWLREITTTSTGSSTGLPFAIKAYALFLRYCLGYTSPTQSVTSGDYWSVEKNGVNGSINLTGSDKDFQDSTAASFVSGDTGKWLLVVDANNPLNPGLYKVTYVSSTTVTLDFRSGGTEYPTQVLGASLSWYLLADNYQVPATSGDYFRLVTPHAYGWGIEVGYNIPSSGQAVSIRIALDANWGGSKIMGPRYFGSYNSKTNWFYAAAESDGSFVYLMNHQSTDNRHNGAYVAHITTYETGRANEEKVALGGSSNNSVGNVDGNVCARTTNDYKWGACYRWDSDAAAQIVSYMVEPTYSGYANGLTVWTSREKNARRSGVSDDREDLLTGTQIITDYDNTSGKYAIYGVLQGHYSVRDSRTDRTAFNDASASPGKDKLKWDGGMAFDWPSITPQH